MVEQSIENLKNVIRITYKSFFIVSAILLISSGLYYIIGSPIIQYARDIGIVIMFLWCWKVKRAMEKKRKKELMENK